MLFTAPAFMFLFLPLSVFFLWAFGKKRKRQTLLIVFAVYYIFLYIGQPQNLLYPLSLIFYCYGAVLLSNQKKMPKVASFFKHPAVFFVICLLPYAALIANHLLAYYGPRDFVYPTGLTVTVISSTCYLLELRRAEKAQKQSLLDLSLYLLFFPVKLVGPILRYSDFCRLTRDDRLSVDMPSLATGARIFCLGVIKRIAIGAPLLEAYGLFTRLAMESPDAVVMIYQMILIYFASFFALTGYLDMGIGIAAMFGIRMERENKNPFRIASPLEYMRMLFGSVCDRVDELLMPYRKNGQWSRGWNFLRSLILTLGVLLVIRPERYVFVYSLFIAFFVWLCYCYRAKGKRRNRTAARVLGGLGTMVLLSVFWMMATFGGGGEILEYVSDMSVLHSEYHLNLILNAFSWVKYLFVILMMIFVLHRRLGGRIGVGGHTSKVDGTTLGVTLVLFVLFLFTLVFFLPRYAVYNSMPFAFLYS